MAQTGLDDQSPSPADIDSSIPNPAAKPNGPCTNPYGLRPGGRIIP